MITLTRPAMPPPPSLLASTDIAWARNWSALVPLIGLGLAAWLVGAGYVGGGADDWWYLEAARCWAAHGGCVATTHWAARLPLVVPMAGALRLFGESWQAAAVVPFAYAAGCVALLSRLVGRWQGRAAGCVAGLVLVATPVFALSVLQPSVDAAELFWLLLAATGLAHARREWRLVPAVWAGVALGLACMTRLTAVAAVPFVLAALWPTEPTRVRQLVAVGLGGAVVLGLEAVGYWWATGSPVHHLRLALHHTRIPSSALAVGVPLDQSPILNPTYINGWVRRMGIHVHWSVDGILNLLASPEVGATLLASALLMLMARVAGVWPAGRALAVLTACAVAHAVLLILVLAVDPGARMFLVELAVAAATIGALGPPLWRAGRRPVLTTLILIAGVKMAVELPNVARMPAYSDRVAAFAPPGSGVVLDDWTHRAFSLEARWRKVGTDDGAGDVLAVVAGSCKVKRPAGAHTVGQRRIDRLSDGGLVFAALARAGLLTERTPVLACHYARGATAG